MGTITWGTNFLLAGVWTKPANGFNRSVTFICNSVIGVANKWVEVYRTAADVAN